MTRKKSAKKIAKVVSPAERRHNEMSHAITQIRMDNRELADGIYGIKVMLRGFIDLVEGQTRRLSIIERQTR